MTIVQTIRRGDTADDRVILALPHTAIPSADPVAATKGLHTQGASFLHVYVDLPVSMTALQVTPWYYSTIAGQWFEGDALAFSATTKIALIQLEGEERVFFVADSVTGTGTFKLWAGYSQTGVLGHL